MEQLTKRVAIRFELWKTVRWHWPHEVAEITETVTQVSVFALDTKPDEHKVAFVNGLKFVCGLRSTLCQDLHT